jgi:endonuclease I
MNKKLLIGFVSLLSLGLNAQTDIANARTYAIGQTVTIKGVVTNGSELGTIRYIQDGTAALPAFGSILNSVQRGDSISATGVLYDYNGLLEISPTNSFVDLGNGTLPSAQIIPIPSAGETLEAQLLQFDNVTFTTTGTFAGNTNYNVTDGTNILQIRISSGSNLVGVAIPTGTVSVRGVLGQFNATYQLLPRDNQDIFAYVAPAKEINVKVGTTTILSGNQYVVGTTPSTTFTIENLGVGNLTVSGSAFSGVNAAEYSTPFTSQVISGGSTTNLVVNFTPTANGSRFATLTISSDDADEASYVIDLYGIGLNGLATEPLTNASNLQFSNIEAYMFNGTYTAAPTAEKYVVLWSNSGTITGTPTDGTTYLRGDVIGNAKVAYVGTGSSFAPRHVIANQAYDVKVFAFNGPAGFENYITTAAPSGTVNTTGNASGTYYSGIDKTSSTFITDLSTLINPHNVISYGNYKPTVMAQFEVRDTTAGQSFVVCSYTGEKKVFNDPFDWTPVGYSREHSYCHSWMPTYPADGTSPKPEYSDQHNLYPVNQNQANAIRSNLPMNEVTGTIVYSYLEGVCGYNGAQLCYEPREANKGNAARSMMYMATCYNMVAGNNWGLGVNQPQDILKTWHELDPADNYEIARNEYIFSVQNNRNPYVDSASYACHVDFQNMTYIATGCDLGVNEQLLDANFSAFPIPATSDLYLQVNGTKITSYSITDLSGKVIVEKNLISEDVVKLNTQNFSKGSFLVKVETPYGATSRMIVIE